MKNGARGRSRTGTGITTRGILSPLRLPISPPGQCMDGYHKLFYITYGGWGRNRTGVHGFAGRCITTLPPSQRLIIYVNELIQAFEKPIIKIAALPLNLERETRLELATPTLARSCSTN